MTINASVGSDLAVLTVMRPVGTERAGTAYPCSPASGATVLPCDVFSVSYECRSLLKLSTEPRAASEPVSGARSGTFTGKNPAPLQTVVSTDKRRRAGSRHGTPV